MSFYQLIWFYANCKPSKEPSIVCALAQQDPHQTEQINLLWCAIHNTISQSPTKDQNYINQIAQLAKSANSPHHLKKLVNPKPPKHLQLRFKQKLKNDQMTRFVNP